LIACMKIISTRAEMEARVSDLKKTGKLIGFVPTMGFLHQGHLSLVEKSCAENDVTVVSIFVNPTQFAPHEDFESYPRDFERDCRMLEGKADIIFHPSVSEIYGSEEDFPVKLEDITACLCGLSRPGHFPGVLQVVARLFKIMKPDNAYFGQKDYQQTVVIKRLIKDLFAGVKIHVCETVREADGLAMSSRNSYLNDSERRQATCLNKALSAAVAAMEKGERSKSVLLQRIQKIIIQQDKAKIDYVDIRDAENLEEVDIIKKPVVVAAAVNFGKTRLIDNVIFKP